MGLFSDKVAETRDQALAAAERERAVFTVKIQHKPDNRGIDNRLDQVITAVEVGAVWRLDSITPLGSGENLLLLFRPGTNARLV